MHSKDKVKDSENLGNNDRLGNTNLPDNSAESAEKPDKELVKLTLEHQEFFLYLIKRYEKKLLSYILRISNVRREEAEDILQDVFIKVYQNLNDFDPELKFSSWIYRITHNQVISNFRKNKARPENITLNLDYKIIDKLASNLDVEREVNTLYLKESINKVLISIDRKYREVLVLRYLEEKDYNEMSDILKKPIGTIATLLSRAKKKFREELDKQDIKL